jgi:hypothetical protein
MLSGRVPAASRAVRGEPEAVKATLAALGATASRR